MRFFLRPLTTLLFFTIPPLALISCAADDDPGPRRAENPCQIFKEEDQLPPDTTLDEGCFELQGLHRISQGRLTVGSDATLYLRQEGGLQINSELLLQPGAKLLFERDAGLDINQGVLIAKGTSEEPVILRGTHEVAGHWQGLRIIHSPRQSELSHVELRHGASLRWRDRLGASRANLFIDEGGLASLNHVLIKDSGHMGLSIQDGTLTTCEALTFSNIGHHHLYPAEIRELCP